MKLLASLLFVFAIAGCATAPTLHKPSPRVDLLVWSDFDIVGRVRWVDQAAKRSGSCAVVFCHGLDEPGEWKLIADDGTTLDAKTVAWVLHDVYRKPVYLVCCNCYGAPLPVPGVFYPKHRIWQAGAGSWASTLHYGVGDVSEFIEGGNQPSQ